MKIGYENPEGPGRTKNKIIFTQLLFVDYKAITGVSEIN